MNCSAPGISVDNSQSAAQVGDLQTSSNAVPRIARTVIIACCTMSALALAQLPGVCLAAGRELALPSIDLLPNAPSTYQMRDWHKTATDFDTLAFNTTASGQFLPLMRIDNTFQPPQTQTWYGLPAYVGETRTFGQTGEPIHEAVASLAAVLGGTLVGVDKTTGPYDWVAMSKEYYVDRNNQFIVLNTPFDSSGNSAWYETYPDILMYAIGDRYPSEAGIQTVLNKLDTQFFNAVNVMTVGGTAPNFNHTAFNFATQTPVDSVDHREPDMGLGMAWIEYAAYRRNLATKPTQAAAHLNAVDWSLSYYQTLSTNPDYEVLTPFGAYTAARMNAELGRNYDVQKMVNWVFTRSNARPDKIMISGGQWGGQDVGGLMGFTHPNTVQSYAFSMNTFITAMPMVPLVRYEDRYSRAIGKWMLNAANAARLFYADQHTPQTQSSSFWTGDPNSSIAYEGLRHHWLAAGDGEEQYAAGDPLTYGWGPQTDFGIYGSAVSGVFGSIIKTTNVDKILQLNLLATDTYHDTAYPTYLYYNPLGTTQSVAIDLGAGAPVDLYDAVSNQYIARNKTGQTFFSLPSDEAMQLVLVPHGGTETRQRRELLVNGVVVDYNATLLPDNLVQNPDVDTALANDATHPAYWHYSTNAIWSADTALSPSHSLELVDNSATSSEEWRNYATAVPAGTGRSLEARWFWKHDIAAGAEFHARLRLSNDAVTSVDLTNPVLEYDFTVSGQSADFDMSDNTIAIPDGIRSFDLTFISGGALSATGTIYVDDISVALVTATALAGDYNHNGVVDAADYTVWRNSFGQSGAGLAADGNGDGQVDQLDYSIWIGHFGDTAGAGASDHAQPVSEPSTTILLFAATFVAVAIRTVVARNPD
jgi:hypothetical protein